MSLICVHAAPKARSRTSTQAPKWKMSSSGARPTRLVYLPSSHTTPTKLDPEAKRSLRCQELTKNQMTATAGLCREAEVDIWTRKELACSSHSREILNAFISHIHQDTSFRVQQCFSFMVEAFKSLQILNRYDNTWKPPTHFHQDLIIFLGSLLLLLLPQLLLWTALH